jgi:hypothetical protein
VKFFKDHKGDGELELVAFARTAQTTGNETRVARPLAFLMPPGWAHASEKRSHLPLPGL